MRRGFTLVELTIVVILIAILAALAIPQFTKVQERAKMATAKAKLDMVRKSQGIYHTLTDEYTTDFSLLATEVPEVTEAKLDNEDWDFEVDSADESSFSASATRERGQYSGSAITINQDGDITEYSL